MLGGLYSAGAVVSRGVRDRDDALNYGVGGMLAGAFLGKTRSDRPASRCVSAPSPFLHVLTVFRPHIPSPYPVATPGMRSGSLHQVVLKGVTVAAAGTACAFLANRVRHTRRPSERATPSPRISPSLSSVSTLSSLSLLSFRCSFRRTRELLTMICSRGSSTRGRRRPQSPRASDLSFLCLNYFCPSLSGPLALPCNLSHTHTHST